MFSLLVAKRNLFDKLDVSTDLKPVDAMNFELMPELVFTRAARENLNFTLRELHGNVDLVN